MFETLPSGFSGAVVGIISGVVAGIVTAIFSVRYQHHSSHQKTLKELKKALDIETKRNLYLASANSNFIENYQAIGPGIRKRVMFVPFHSDVWVFILTHGLTDAFGKEDIASDLRETYNLIYELNSIMLKQDYEETICSPICSFEKQKIAEGISFSSLVLEKSRELEEILSNLRIKLQYD